ncbi:hypothetical protein HDU83_001922 [Entophlyctis luteolus]|nr:hypothetical protein HDU82_006460 [Entophlyctis luteolus]KAJ3347611.1 hypothetical protein HDU83_001922 [Entophlyctis luteolus]KAJ3387272.1 hypothetical protein HDU84_000921 [Entophlyctis sp. JEL0112]
MAKTTKTAAPTKKRRAAAKARKPYSYAQQPSKARRDDVLVFDEAQRLDYLTGFHKRKQDKIKAAKARDAKLERDEKRAARKDKRGKLGAVMDDVRQIEEIVAARRETAAARTQPDGEQDTEARSSSTVVEQTKRVVGGGRRIVTVTVEDMPLG